MIVYHEVEGRILVADLFPFLLNFLTMSHPAAPLPSDLESNCPDEEVIWTLFKFKQGCPLPRNVIKDIDPYDAHPEFLPDRTWFLGHSEVKTFNDYGIWKVKGTASNVFSDSTTTGLRTTLEFYDSQAPHKRITNRVMQEYCILQEGHSEGSNVKETSTLCIIFSDGEQNQNHVKQSELGSTDTASENHIHPTRSIVPNTNNSIGQSSSSQPQASEDDDIVMLGLTEHQNLHEIDYPPEGDFLELEDLLDDPASPSSSESSCVTMSSDECFDSLALLQELKPENNQNGAGCKFSVSAPVKPNEVKVLPATAGSLDRDREKMLTPSAILKTDSSTPESAVRCQVNRIQKPNFRNEGPSSNSHNVTPPFSGHNFLAADKEKMAPVVKKKKCWKYLLCFMSF
ncbi:uncharacterized protein LOC112025493 isoform X1 [Quercus suber]|uniref:uncharacterized protein LOC112025493 isoform X1 n=2 Tax=Quercus suber TaxID=58331 RepID=UPI000CE2507A|nr:uncharacterized protein LOC112025493 isoform X1 [Quercus suber]